jgi:hypothetical protein
MFTAIRRALASLLLLSSVCSHHPRRHRSSAFSKEGGAAPRILHRKAGRPPPSPGAPWRARAREPSTGSPAAAEPIGDLAMRPLRLAGVPARSSRPTTTDLWVGDRRPLWVVHSGTTGLALETARADGCNVDGIVGTLSEETVERLAIQPGQAKLL